ncbi:MAG: 50S ribosomal protein L21 [Eubacteriales bacterium]|nr:50S ribosomal protein L21 [Eubacteriales bacterium]
MYAIVESGGRQYKVQEGEVVFLEKLDFAEGESVELDKVVAVSDEGKLNVGAPYVNGAKVSVKVLGHGKDKKIIIFKFKAKKGYRRKQGHRQPYTKVQVEKISV